jgi:hypothetical protein
VVPTLTDPYLSKTNTDIPYNPNPPFYWLHYRPSWVEWSITLGGTAVFLLMYMLFTKLFPIVSIWETRLDEAQAERAMAPAPETAAQRLGSIPTTIILLIACVLFGAGHSWAAQKHKAKVPEATTLKVEWQKLPPLAPVIDGAQQIESSAPPVRGLERFVGRLFGWVPVRSNNDGRQPPPRMEVTVTLLGANGEPLAYQVVGLTLKTSFGKLDYGDRPTNAEGKAQFSIQEQRYGVYPVEGKFEGGDDFAAAHAVASVDFGPRPEISLPAEGVLIAPYTTPWVGIPFFIFFGLTWFAFVYFGGYVLFWRLPQVRKHRA